MIKSFSKIVALTLYVGASFFNTANAADKLISNLEKNNSAAKKTPPSSSAPSSKVPGKVHAHTVHLGIGETILYGDMGDNGEDGIRPDLYYTYSASFSFDFVANLHYAKFDNNRKSVTASGLALGIKSRIFQFDSFSPFVIGGLGFYMPIMERIVNSEVVESKSKVVMGTHAAIGADLNLNDHFSIGVLYHWHNPFDIKEDASKGGIVEGSYGKLLLTVGYTF